MIRNSFKQSRLLVCSTIDVTFGFWTDLLKRDLCGDKSFPLNIVCRVKSLPPPLYSSLSRCRGVTINFSSSCYRSGMSGGWSWAWDEIQSSVGGCRLGFFSLIAEICVSRPAVLPVLRHIWPSCKCSQHASLWAPTHPPLLILLTLAGSVKILIWFPMLLWIRNRHLGVRFQRYRPIYMWKTLTLANQIKLLRE